MKKEFLKFMESLKIFQSIKSLRAARESLGTKTLGFVPTMGALHEGHLELVRQSLRNCDETWVSIFVNPTQFGPNEDFGKYPRQIERDLELLQSIGTHAVFQPSVSEMYPENAFTRVNVGRISEGLCGKFRPGHFEGVATIVAKLFHLVEPQTAFFGQKDYQQCMVIDSMVRDLNFPVKISVIPTVREDDGLAMSSRNAYLSPEQRKQALVLYKTLSEVKEAYLRETFSVEALLALGKKILTSVPEFEVQYFEIVHPTTLLPLKSAEGSGGVALIAGYLGKTRLIDNMIL